MVLQMAAVVPGSMVEVNSILRTRFTVPFGLAYWLSLKEDIKLASGIVGPKQICMFNILPYDSNPPTHIQKASLLAAAECHAYPVTSTGAPVHYSGTVSQCWQILLGHDQ